MTSFNIYEAYAAVYNQDLREEILTVEEDFSFIDDLSDNELVQVMEEILSEGEVTLDECFDAFDAQILSEESEMERMNRLMNKRTREKKAATATEKREKSAERERVGRKHAIKRLQVATTRAGSNLADKAKTTASQVSKKAKEGVKKVGGKLTSAKEKIKGFLGKVGRAVKAGASAAKKEFSGEAGREASARTTGRQMRRAARQQASAERGRDTSAFEKPKAEVGTPENPRVGQPAPERKALPPSQESGRRIKAAAKAAIAAKGSSSKGVRVAGSGGVSPLATTKKMSTTYAKAASGQKRSAKKATVSEEYAIITDMIAEDLIAEGYASNIFEAYEVILEMDLIEVGEIAENYLVEETETVDLYDVVLEHLLDEGFADTEEAATVIMANMSEDWREEILDEAAVRNRGLVSGRDKLANDAIDAAGRTVPTHPKGLRMIPTRQASRRLPDGNIKTKHKNKAMKDAYYQDQRYGKGSSGVF